MRKKENPVNYGQHIFVKCFICSKREEIQRELTSSSVPLSKKATVLSQDSENEKDICLRNHMVVIFVLKTFFGIPEPILLQFLKEHGNPGTWIQWCKNCSSFVKEAKLLSSQIAILEKRFNGLRGKVAKEIINSENDSFSSKRKNENLKPREIVRSCIIKKFADDFQDEIPDVLVKIEENVDSCSSKNVPDGNAILGIEKDILNNNEGNLENSGDEGNEYSDNGTDNVSEEDQESVLKKIPANEVNTIKSGNKVRQCEICCKDIAKKSFSKHRLTHSPPCPYCSKVFVLKKDFPDHVLEHVGEELKVSDCSVCGDKYVDFADVVKHVCTKIKPFSCSHCEKTFVRKDVLRKHELTHLGPRPYQCCSCDKSFTNSWALKCHDNSIHKGIKPNPCPACPSAFITSGDLKRHMERVHCPEKRYMCTTCGKSFSIVLDLRSHEKVHAESKPFSCSECGKGFLTQRRLTIHLRTHTGERPFLCLTCGASFRDSTELQKHTKRVHSQEKMFLCTICGKRMASGYARHVRSHKGLLRPFPCPTCGKMFASAKTVEDHQMIHRGIKPFECKICNKKFRFEHVLKFHENIHTGQKSYECNVCQRRFFHEKSLKAHLRTHSEDPLPYPCSYCQKRYNTSHSLKEHERTHTGERPFSCHLCHKTFTRRSHLKVHNCQSKSKSKSKNKEK